MAAVQSVWVKLYIGQDDQNPRVTKVKPIPEDVYDLKEKIKEKEQNGLAHADASQLLVYPQGTDVSNLEEAETLDPGSTVSVGTTSRTPLIVVAPRIPEAWNRLLSNTAAHEKSIFSHGFLEDKDGLALADDDLFSPDGAPYVFKQQHGGSEPNHRSLAQQVQKTSRYLLLFELVFRNIPTGSSGLPHIHEDLKPFPMDQLKPFKPKERNTALFRYFHQVDNEVEGKVYYSRELQVQTHLANVVKDVIRSCKYDLETDTEAALNGLKVDVGIIRNGNDAICGTIEVKQPKRKNMRKDPNPMVHPKVVTQVLSQMIPLRTLYGVKNVYGILSTYSSWRFFRWVPEGEDINGLEAAGQMVEKLHISEPRRNNAVRENPYLTPHKARSEVDAHKARNSPPMSPKPYCDADQPVQDDDEEEDDFTGEIKQGTLYASAVISDGPQALKMLAWVLGEMAASPVDHIPAHERDYLYVVQKNASGGYTKLDHTPNYYKGRMPKSSNQTLYILEELGHRYHGRVYRAMSKNGNLCVLKYFVKSQYAVENGRRVEVGAEAAARKSVEYWNMAYGYDKWLPNATFGKWGGGDAIVMPDLERVSADVESKIIFQMLKQTLKTRFFERGLWHGDPAWRNVALIRNNAGMVSKVCMIDLEPAHIIEKVETSKWNVFEVMWTAFEQELKEDWERFEAAP